MSGTHKLISKSISSRLYRSLGIALIGVLLSTAIVLIGLILLGTEHGGKNMVERLGADLIIVPDGHGDEMEGMLITAKKSFFYMDDSVLDRIGEIEGVEKVSPQTFLMTLEASCCDQPVQIIGIDTDSDFTVKPWIDKSFLNAIDNGEIIVGSSVGVKEDKTFQMFGKKYNVAAVLDESGSSMDVTVFVSRDYMDTLITDAREAGQGIVKEITGKDISAVLIKAADKDDIQRLVGKLSSIEGVDVVTTDLVSSKLSQGIGRMKTVYAIIAFAFLLVSIALLYIIYYITLNERKKEFETLRIVGVSKSGVKKFLIEEAFWISFPGAVLGAFFGLLVFDFIYRVIEMTLNLPFISPYGYEKVIVLLISLILTAIIGPACVAFNIKKTCPTEVLE